MKLDWSYMQGMVMEVCSKHVISMKNEMQP